MAVHPTWDWIYVCEDYNGTQAGDIAIVSLTTHTITGTIPIGPIPARLAVSPSGDRLYVSNWGSYGGSPTDGSGGITIIDPTDNHNKIAKVMMGNAWGVTVSDDGETLYATKSVDPANGLWVIDAQEAESCPDTGYYNPAIHTPCSAVIHDDLPTAPNSEPGDIEFSSGRLFIGDATPPSGVYEWDASIAQTPTYTNRHYHGTGVSIGVNVLDHSGKWLFEGAGPAVDAYDTTSPSPPSPIPPAISIPMGSHATYSAGDMAITCDGLALVVPNIWQGTVSFVDLTAFPSSASVVAVQTVGAPEYYGGSWPANAEILESCPAAGPEAGAVGGVAELVVDGKSSGFGVDIRVVLATVSLVVASIGLAALFIRRRRA